MASMAPVTDRIRSLVVFVGGAGGRGLGGGGLDGAALPFFGCGGVTGATESSGDSASPKRSSEICDETGSPNRFAVASLSVAANIFVGWLVNMLASEESVVVVSKPVLGATVSTAKEANGFVDSAATVDSYD